MIMSIMGITLMVAMLVLQIWICSYNNDDTEKKGFATIILLFILIVVYWLPLTFMEYQFKSDQIIKEYLQTDTTTGDTHNDR